MPYPPVAGPFGVFTQSDLYKSINYSIMQYNQTNDKAIGTYQYNSSNNVITPISFCVYQYKTGRIFAYNQTYFFDPEIISECYNLGNFPDDFDIEQYLLKNGKPIEFDRFVKAELQFTLNTIHLNQLSKINKPDCLGLKTTILYDNSAQSGQVLIDLEIKVLNLECNSLSNINSTNAGLSVTLGVIRSLFDVIVMILNAVSFTLCLRSLYRGQLLRDLTESFFKKQRNIEFTVHERLEFFDGWYSIIIIQDTLVIFGSIFKIAVDNKLFHSYETCGMCLGVGNLLMWFGVLRYLGFFDHYNILILTLKKSAPDMLRFICCAAVFYVGYCLCGWVILGPYHIKFQDLMTTSECLFSLINGDDMFVTFSVIKDTDRFVWWFARVYLYTFICLFIYVVLSVFIAVIMDVYETIKHNSKVGYQRSRIRRFIEECQIECDSPLYRSDEQFMKFRSPIFPCCHCSEYICVEEVENLNTEDRRSLLNVNGEANDSE